ncbi:hypothetical protein [Halopiger aswanensis]|uniref:Uncharacterized protein n=1 Tax=Halopiger aswanensis TaxID=148449 RepID=A0A419WH71_9EURY|nr:hypothetical protein [Halopiger aswanensis]RKD94870.1 hypothetical protein ATJ93_1713 [Halopiger aswanensis]
MNTQKAILVELVGITLVLFGGFHSVSDTYFLSEWDLIGNMTTWMAGGVIIGFYGVVAGLRPEQ